VTAHDPRADRADHRGEEARPTILQRGREIIDRCRARAPEGNDTRFISLCNRRRLARWLRRTAAHAQEPDPIARRRRTLLHDRVAAVRTDLLEIAAMLERTQYPDPASIAALHDLLANGCDSPLHNSDIHISELQATLYYIRAGLPPIRARDPLPAHTRHTNPTPTRTPWK
jgi:hypothetical protein